MEKLSDFNFSGNCFMLRVILTLSGEKVTKGYQSHNTVVYIYFYLFCFLSLKAGKHEAIVKNVHDLLAKLAWDFSPEQLDHLFDCFKVKVQIIKYCYYLI